MSRARFQEPEDWQAAVALENGSGCLSFYVLPPLAALVIAGFLVFLALSSPISPAALPINNSTLVLQNGNGDWHFADLHQGSAILGEQHCALGQCCRG
jgi:hypothetical protein